MFYLKHSIIYQDERFFASFPSVVQLATGEIMVLFRRARDQRWFARALLRSGGGTGDGPCVDDKALTQVDHVDARSHLVLLRLSAGLTPVAAPFTLPPDPEAADQDANLLALPDGRLLVSGFCWYPVTPAVAGLLHRSGSGTYGNPADTGCSYLFWGGYTRQGSADGRVWSAHHFLPAIPGAGDLVPIVRPHFGGAVRGRMILLDQGGILLPSYAPNVQGRRGSHVFFARSGEEWDYRAPLAHDPQGQSCLVEPALQQTRSGRVIAFHRTTAAHDRLVTAFSLDEGRHWSKTTTHNVVGHPYDALRLSDGRFLLVYGYRHAPYGVRARLYDPERETPEAAREIIIRADAAGPDVGYPWACQCASGEVVIVYYFVGADGIRRIDASLLAL